MTRKLIVINIVSLDGFYTGPGDNVMALPMDGAFDAYNLACMRAAGTVLLGHTSYGMFSGFWPGMADKPEASPTHRAFAQRYHEIPKVVVSRTLSADQLTGPWRATTRVVTGDVHAQIAALKREPGDPIIMYASRTLWNDLLAHDLVDELHFVVGNVVLGGGTPAFVTPIGYDDPRRALQLVEARPLEGSQNLLVRYEVVAR